jgi:hypothetical protein
MENEQKPPTKKPRKARMPKIGAYIVQRKTDGGWLDMEPTFDGLRDLNAWLEVNAAANELYRPASIGTVRRATPQTRMTFEEVK